MTIRAFGHTNTKFVRTDELLRVTHRRHHMVSTSGLQAGTMRAAICTINSLTGFLCFGWVSNWLRVFGMPVRLVACAWARCITGGLCLDLYIVLYNVQADNAMISNFIYIYI